MEYPVIVEQKNGVWRAVIPALSDLSAEGTSYDEAVQKARQAAEAFLSKVRITTIELNEPNQELRRGSPKSVLKALGKFKGDEEAMRQHIEEIYSERRRQREEAEHETE
jgi:predicted RNase H-like HicB family nuclease